MSEQNEKKWYVIRAVSGKEKKVKEKPDKKFFSRKKTVSKTKVEKTNTKKGSK